MKTGFFMQNVKRGGLDTFVLQLACNWRSPNDLIVFCNLSHPGIEDLRRHLPVGVELVSYNFLVANDLAKKVKNQPRLLSMASRGIFWAIGFWLQVFHCRKMLDRQGIKHLMIINGGYPGGDACLAATVAWATLGPTNLAWHNFHNISLPYPQSIFRRVKERFIDELVARSVTGFVSVSKACLESLSKERPALSKKPGVTIYNGIDEFDVERTSDLRSELGLPSGCRIVLMLGVYEPRKGHAFAIRVMEKVIQQCPDVWLVACGDGLPSEIKEVKLMRDASPAGAHVILLPHRDDLPSIFAQVDLLIMPSQAQESFGYAVLEAMASNLPVVVSDVGGLPEVVVSETTGYVVNHHDHEAFSRHVIKLLCDPDLSRRMGKAGRKRYLEYFQAKRMGDQYYRLLVR